MKVKQRILNVLFWSVVAAAFIGPGTVITATKAGATFDFDLLWALVFSTFACLLLQEASARVTITSGMNLGQAIAKQFENQKGRNAVLILIIGAIIIGCAAYETGNIIGATSGLELIFKHIPKKYMVVGMGILAFFALSLPSLISIARFMGIIVFLMGVAFFTTAVQLHPSFIEILKGSFIPKMPSGSGAGLIVLGLIGTTVVPYDIFLGSGVLEKKQAIGEMRFGLSVAIILGGVISMAILSVGTSIDVEGEFTFLILAETLTSKIGPWAVYIFGFGMFAAGFSSAITAPLASALTAKSLFQKNEDDNNWSTKSLNFRTVWFVVLITGIIFGLMNIKPIPAIIFAQAMNGLILPFISIFLILVVNNIKLMGEDGVNSWLSNVLMIVVVWITLILGCINIVAALEKVVNTDLQTGFFYYSFVFSVSFIVSLFIFVKVYKIRRAQANEEFKTK